MVEFTNHRGRASEAVPAASYAVVLLMSWTLCRGSMESGQRRMHGANTIASALADIRFVSSCKAILEAGGGCENRLCYLD